MLQAEEFISAIIARGYTFFTGVPCSFLKPLINYVISCKDLKYISASSEGEAVGIAAGAYLAGRKGVVMCQNSGLGNMINPLTSLNFPFRIPVLLIVTLRGAPGLKDEPQHELMGQITGKLLDTLRIRWSFLSDDPKMTKKVLDQAESQIGNSGLPFALIMKKGTVEKTNLEPGVPKISEKSQTTIKGQFYCNPGERMPRMKSIKIVHETISNEDAVIATTGKIGRELFSLGDSHNQLYVVGSMGCAAGIGFGIQHVRPKQCVIVLDGDGAALMKMGTLATIGHYQPSGLIHTILDNESYESTGGQLTVSTSIEFGNVAAACGYKQCYRTDTKSDLISAINSAKILPGPSLIHVKVSCDSAPDLGRPTLKPFQVKERFMRFMERGAGND